MAHVTEQFQSAWDALAACLTPDAVADLMRRHGCYQRPPDRGAGQIGRLSPIYVYFHVVGGVPLPVLRCHESGVSVNGFEGPERPLPPAARAFLAAALDYTAYTDLMLEKPWRPTVFRRYA